MEKLREELLKLIETDERVRAELAHTGELFDGYHPRMAAIHTANAKRLDEIVSQYGWPDITIAGKDGAEAAWRIAQHAIDQPEFQRRMLVLLQQAAANGRLEHWQVALLEDRISALEGRPQKYGTQFDWDESGEMSPFPEIEDPSKVDQYRASVGLPPLREAIAAQRKAVKSSTESRPKDIRKRREEMDAWAKSVGWRKK